MIRLVLLALVIGSWLQIPPTIDRSGSETAGSVEPSVLSKVEPALLKEALEGNKGSQFRFIVELAHQVSLASLPETQTRLDHRHEVVTTLQATAMQTQADLLSFLQARQLAGQVQQIHPFWIFNGLGVIADADTLLALASRPEVRMIREDRWRRWVEPFPLIEGLPRLDGSSTEWNIAQIRADLAWSALGLDGNGVTVAIMDTGVDWQHPALLQQYRGYKQGGLAIHQGNWLCTTDEAYLYPVDGYGHGTHVAGIAVGTQDSVGRAIGVAPAARWIAVKMLDDQGYAYDSWIHAAFEWIMAPAGDPGLAPDVVNGSWGSRDAQDETFRADLQALRTVDIVPVFSAGNEGPYASSIRSPASHPEAIAVGAADDLDEVASFSSRGPSPWGEIKPEVIAPGVQIRSTLPGGTYGVHDGTSMAAPHVSGLVALMLEADPSLTAEEIEAILTSTAHTTSEVPNNDSGWGRIDAYDAASTALNAGIVAGQVSRHPDLQPLPTAEISVYDDLGEQRAIVRADSTGRYQAALPAGRYSMKISAFGYASQTVPGVTVVAAVTTTVDLALSPMVSGVLWGQIIDAETGGPVGADLSIVGTPAFTASDPQTGQYSLNLPAGVYTLKVARNGYRRHTDPDLEIVADQATRLNVALVPAPTLLIVDSGPWYYRSQRQYFEQALDDSDYVYDLWEIRDLTIDLPGLDDLSTYDVTVWSSPLDAPGVIGAGDTISNYLSMGGNLFLSGQDVGFWDGGLSGVFWHPYYGKLLKAKAIADDAGPGDLLGLPGEILDGISLAMNGPDSAGNQSTPDLISLADPREAAIIGSYQDSGDAAVRASGCQSYHAVYLAAGLEGLGDRASRAEVMERALTWLGASDPAVGVSLYPPRQEKVWLQGTTVTYTVNLQNIGDSPDRFDLELSHSVWPTSVWDETFSHEITRTQVLSTCQAEVLGIKVEVPPEVKWNLSEVVTLTARSEADRTHTAQAGFQSKAPAPILLVDGHRWYDVIDSYRAVLDARRLPYDIWMIDAGRLGHMSSVSLQRLQRYPMVVWFTAYDWLRTLTQKDELQLATYLDEGGRLLLSSQDYLYTGGFTDFPEWYLGVAGYVEGLTTTQVTEALGTPIGNGLGSYELEYPFRNWSDALTPSPGAQTTLWGQHAQPAALTLEQSPWKTAFFAFPLESLQEEDMVTVVGRTVDWLSPLGDSSLTVDHPVAAQEDELGYTLQIRNTGPRLLNSVSLSNTVPPSTTYVDSSLQGPAHYDPLTRQFTWNGALDAGQTITVSYHLQLDASLPDGAVISNVAHLSDESGLSLDRLSTVRVNTPDLSSSGKIVSLKEATPGQTLTYTLALRNEGLQPAYARLTDPLPRYTTYEPGSGFASSGHLTSTAEVLYWTGSISVGGMVTITFPVVISPSTTRLFVLNRAILEDGWNYAQPLEVYTWVEAQIFLPLVLKQP
jgi:uncharacterized repeat protein (TIGR01451 family)